MYGMQHTNTMLCCKETYKNIQNQKIQHIWIKKCKELNVNVIKMTSKHWNAICIYLNNISKVDNIRDNKYFHMT